MGPSDASVGAEARRCDVVAAAMAATRGIGAINVERWQVGDTRAEEDGMDVDAAETQEAQEARLRKRYAHVLRERAHGKVQQAREAAVELLQEPLLAQEGARIGGCDGRTQQEDEEKHVASRCTPVVRQLRFLVAKQAGELLEKDGEASWTRAATCYAIALRVKQDDAGIWRKLGKMCLKYGAVAAARNALEAGLACQPEDGLLLQALLETLVEAKDRMAASKVARKLLEKDPGNPKAMEVVEAQGNGWERRDQWRKMQDRWKRSRLGNNDGIQTMPMEQDAACPRDPARAPKESLAVEADAEDPFEPNTKCIQLPCLSWRALVTSLSTHVEALAASSSRGIKRTKRGAGNVEEAPVDRINVSIPQRVLFHVALGCHDHLKKSTTQNGSQERQGENKDQESRQEGSTGVDPPSSAKRAPSSVGKQVEKQVLQRTAIPEEMQEDDCTADAPEGSKANRGTRISARLARQAQEETDIEKASQVEVEDHPSQILSCFSPSLDNIDEALIVDGEANLLDAEDEALDGTIPPTEVEMLGVKQFLQQYNALQCVSEQITSAGWGCNFMWLISGLLEQCLKGSVDMETLSMGSMHTLLQMEHLCRTNALSDPVKELAFAEMHADVALAKLKKRDQNMQVLERVFDAEHHLAAFQAMEASNALSAAWVLSGDQEANLVARRARFLWTMACAAEAKKDRARAALLYSKCAELCLTLETSQVDVSTHLKRKHCLISPEISSTLARSRAKALEIFSRLQIAQEKLQKQSYSGIVEDLAPLLVPKFAPGSLCTKNAQSSRLPEGTLTVKERLDGLRTLQLAAEHDNEPHTLVLFGSLLEQLALSCSHFTSLIGRGKSEIFLKRRRRFANVVHALTNYLQRLSSGSLKGVEVILEAAEKTGVAGILAQDVRRVVPGLVDVLKWEVGALTRPGVKVTQRQRKAESNMNHKGVSIDISCLLCTLHGLDMEHTIENPSACALLVKSIHSMLAEKGICCWSSGSALKCSIIQASLMKKKIMTKLMSMENLTSLTDVRKLLRESDEDGTSSEDERQEKCIENDSRREIDTREKFSIIHAKALLEDLDRAVFQCIRCLYGVDLIDGSLQCHENIGSAQLTSQQACRNVWEQIHPLLADQPNRSSRMGEILADISLQFPPLTDVQLEAETGVSIKAFLELDVDEEMFLKGHTPSYLIPKVGIGVGQNLSREDRDLYSSLYRYLQLVQNPSLEASDQGQLLDTVKAMEAIDSITHWLRVDLSFNPDSFDSWLQLAARYEEAIDIILNDASLVWSPREWSEKQELWELTNRFRCCARKCFLAARLCAPDIKSQCSAEEYLGQNLYEALQDNPPLCDLHAKPSWRALQSMRQDSAEYKEVQSYTDPWDRSAWTSGIMFNLAAKGFPHEWMYPYYRGKGIEKLIAHSASATVYAINKRCVALALYAEAVHFARVYEGGLLEPFYRLHASRFKLLVPTSTRRSAPLHLSLQFPTRQEHKIGTPLLLLARHCFLPDTLEKISVLLERSGISLCMQKLREMDCAKNETALSDSYIAFWQDVDLKLGSDSHHHVWKLLFDDCVEAMKFCIARHKYFHKATYRLAAAYAASGFVDEALATLRACFTQKHKYFSVQMWEINDVSLGGGSQKKRSRRVEKTNSGHAVESLNADIDKEEQSTFGRNTSLTGVGWEESRRRWVGCIRKYCFLYLRLLSLAVSNGSTISFKSLGSAALVLHDNAAQYPYMQDVKEYAFVQHLLALTGVLSGRIDLFDDAESGGEGTEVIEKPTRESLLERAFSWYSDVSSRVDCWDAFVENAVKASNPTAHHSTAHMLQELGSESMRRHALAFLSTLSSNMDTERLSSIATTLRRKFKSLQHDNQTGPLALCRGLATSLTSAVAAKLSALESADGLTEQATRDAAFILAHELMAIFNWKMLDKTGDWNCGEADPGSTAETSGAVMQLQFLAPDLLPRLALLISGESMSTDNAILYCREITRIKKRGLDDAHAAATLAINQTQGNRDSGGDTEETE